MIEARVQWANKTIKDQSAIAAESLRRYIERFHKVAKEDSYAFAITSSGERLAIAEHEAALWAEGASTVADDPETGAIRFARNLDDKLYNTAWAAPSSNDLDRSSKIRAIANVLRQIKPQISQLDG